MSLSCQVSVERGAFHLEMAFDSAARVIAVQGASGAGKTTLLHALAGLLPVKAARLSVDGVVLVDSAAGLEPPAHRRRIGLVFQDGRLLPHKTVAGNIAFARKFARGPVDVEGVLAMLDLQDFGPRWPKSLSGGEMRRVAIARALCADPALLLLDEPFAGLDQARRDALMPYLLRLRDEIRLPMILVSHDPRDIAALAQESVRIEAGQRA